MNEEIKKLGEENWLLRKEVKVARKSAEVTAQLVISQFELSESYIQRVRLANAIQKAVLDAASRISIIAADRNGVIRLFNKGAEEMLGYSADEVIGKATPEMFHLQSELEVRCKETSRKLGHSIKGAELFFEYAKQEFSQEEEWTCIKKNGIHFPVSLSVTAMHDQDEEITGFLCASMDITHRKKAELEIIHAKEAAEAANRSKSAFLANMSHELRTPLNAIIGYSEMLQEDAEDMKLEDFVVDLQKISAAGKHLLSLINDVLDLSKVEAGKLALHIETFAIKPLVDEIEATIQPLVEKNANSLEVQCLEEVGEMRADFTRIRQILFNLLSNACKFTEKGKIRLEASRVRSNGKEYIQFLVSDTGIGMSQKQLEKIFEAFIQADLSTTRQYGGTGLGLAISKSFCEMMGGRIEVESEPRKGSRFTVVVPADVEKKIEKERTAETLRSVSEAGPEEGLNTVLVIDDDPTVHDLMDRYLSKRGFKLHFASNGKEGLELARKIKPAAITLDVLMPEMDGWMCLRKLKLDPELSHIPVIMMTIVDDLNMGFSLGAKDYLVKPVSRDQLITVMNKYKRTERGVVLAVEDDQSTREMYMKMIEKEGWDAVGAENGKVALERLETVHPDIILLDLMMPVMDGFVFMEEIRKREDLCSIPVIVATAKTLTKKEIMELNGQVNAILQKGAYEREGLLLEIHDLLVASLQEK